ncbi:MAG: translation initiation factor IF-2 [candidate division WS6 bacterium 36_33]|uniref:Translation initiation factor IF-2 n=1 Tax=candidate division WS6 bacterium 36_33 TaxID=1641388 RepID=A0A101GZK7_9BACT|nr:MAG: translation initiation factor IF-2 [candidate division WS6 bacterium 36_33]
MAKEEKDTKQKVEGTTNCVRPPIVTILGHVDHGKTTILDKIRQSNVQDCEVGGITQKVSVFTVDVSEGKRITFIDTPGHEAFDLMRTRGGSIADIVLLVVAADAGVKPQTKESIEIIKNSDAKPIVVINKVDLPDVQLDKVKREIVSNGLQIEGLGGKIPVIEVSGKTGKGIPELLELILLVAEVEGVKSGEELPEGVLGKAYVLESVKDKFKGNTSSVALVQGGICQGDWLGYRVGEEFILEKVKGMVTEEGGSFCVLDCGCGGKIIGISHLLELGTVVYALENKDEKLLKSLFSQKKKEEKEEVTMEEFFTIREEGDDTKFLNVIVKSSSEGSLEAILKSLSKIEEDGYKVNIVDSGVGNVTQKDVELAELSKSIVIGFEVGVESGVSNYAKKQRILIKTYDIIYKLIEEIEEAISLMSLPSTAEEEIGNATVRQLFTLSDGTTILGSRVEEGVLKKDHKCDIVRDDEIIAETKIKTLRINKATVTEVQKGFDCGIQLMDKGIEVKEGDKIYCYKVIK